MARRFPDALTFLLLCLAIATALTWIVPAGEYQRRPDAATARQVVVAGTYHRVAAAPVGPFAALVAIPRGIANAATVIAFVLLVGAGFTVVDQTGALRDGVDWLIWRLSSRQAIVVPIVCALFAIGGVLEGMMEEIIPLVPVLLVVTSRLGYRPVTAVSMSLGVAAVGGAFSPMNPFQVGIAQKLAGLPLLSGWTLRLAFAVPALLFATWWTMRARGGASRPDAVAAGSRRVQLQPRTAVLLVIVLCAFIGYLVGVLRFGWEFDEMAALFLVMGIVAGLVGGLGVAGTTDGLAEGFRGMAYAGVLIGLARAIYLVLEQGRIIDTLVAGLFLPVSYLPRAVAGIGMMIGQAVLHVPVPSTTGQAVLSMPILVPVSDLLNLSPQITVLAYQFGAGLCELLTPTNGAMMAIIAAAHVSYEEWVRFIAPLVGALMLLGAVAIVVGVMIGV